MAPATCKRKRSIITLEKLEVTDELKKSKSQRRVAEDFQLPKPTVGNIWEQS